MGFEINNGILIKYSMEFSSSSGAYESEVIIPDGVTAIGNYAFKGCTSLTGIKIPDSVSTIGFSAFYDCWSLTGISIPDGVTDIGDSAFNGCMSIANITIPDNVTDIWYSTFEGCESLTGISIPDSVTYIGDSAFEGCVKLASITIPGSVTTIGMDAFSDCPLRYVVCYTPYVVSYFGEHKCRTLVYLGGPVSDLDKRYWGNAARGFMYAMEQGLTQISQWRDGYLEYIKDHVSDFMEDAKSEWTIVLFLIKEELLDQENARNLLEIYSKIDDIETKAALLQYIHDKFGSDGGSDLTF